MSRAKTFPHAAETSACQHAREEGVAILEYDECALVITRHPKARTVQNTDLLATIDGEPPKETP